MNDSYCNFCEEPIGDNAKFCCFCGTAVDNVLIPPEQIRQQYKETICQNKFNLIKQIMLSLIVPTASGKRLANNYSFISSMIDTSFDEGKIDGARKERLHSLLNDLLTNTCY